MNILISYKSFRIAIEIKAVPFRQIEDDVIQALEHIRDKGIKTGLITNVRPEEGAAWEGCRLSPLFDEVVFSCKVGSVKPEPQIYHIACSNLGVTPKQSLFIGDGGHDELSGASEIGMTPYWATWFLDRWPSWKGGGPDREKSSAFPRLKGIDDLAKVVAEF